MMVQLTANERDEFVPVSGLCGGFAGFMGHFLHITIIETELFLFSGSSGLSR